MKVNIVSKTGCPFCVMAKDWFREHKIDFSEDLLDDPNDRQHFYESTGTRTVPQIYIDGLRIGGYTDLMRQANDVLAMKGIENLNEDF